MVVLAIFVSAVAGTIILSSTITHGLNGIKHQLSDIKDELNDMNHHFENFESLGSNAHFDMKHMTEVLGSLKKILVRNFRIAMNDEEFENL